ILSTVANLLKGCANCGPKFPNGTTGQLSLFNYTFGVEKNAHNKVVERSTNTNTCSDFGESTSGLYWVAGDCDISADVGSRDAPVIVIIDGDLTLSGDIAVKGVIYMVGSDN